MTAFGSMLLESQLSRAHRRNPQVFDSYSAAQKAHERDLATTICAELKTEVIKLSGLLKAVRFPMSE